MSDEKYFVVEIFDRHARVPPLAVDEIENVPIGERCFRGCTRRAVIADGDYRYCAACHTDNQIRGAVEPVG